LDVLDREKGIKVTKDNPMWGLGLRVSRTDDKTYSLSSADHILHTDSFPGWQGEARLSVAFWYVSLFGQLQGSTVVLLRSSRHDKYLRIQIEAAADQLVIWLKEGREITSVCEYDGLRLRRCRMS
jgi:hypothetical protein